MVCGSSKAQADKRRQRTVLACWRFDDELFSLFRHHSMAGAATRRLTWAPEESRFSL
jgi:hypothetical protein